LICPGGHRSARLILFAGIFFLWFAGVIRDRLGAAEDKFIVLRAALAALLGFLIGWSRWLPGPRSKSRFCPGPLDG
jgi:hypothetical protein